MESTIRHYLVAYHLMGTRVMMVMIRMLAWIMEEGLSDSENVSVGATIEFVNINLNLLQGVVIQGN